MKSYITLSLLSLLMSGSLFSQESAIKAAAEKALSDFRELTALEGGQKEGMPSSSDLANARTGQAIQQKVIGLNDLKEFNTSSDPQKIIRNLDKVSVPVENARGEVIARIDLDNSKKEWQVSELTGPDQLRAYERVRKALDLKPEQAQLVLVPSLGLAFLGTTRSGEMQLALTGDQSVADIKPGDLQPAANVLRQLVPVAKEHNGLPW